MPALVSFLLVFLVIGAILIVLVAWLIALALLRPPRMNDGKAIYLLRRLSPGDLSLPFEITRFDVRDEQTDGATKLHLAAWWIPSPRQSTRCVILIHGYADAKVGAIAWAPLWHALDFNVLALDLRAHGESDGYHTTGGFFERHDLCQIIDELRRDRPDSTRQIILFGVSLGAAVALATAAMRDDIAALVLECPFADYRPAATAHARRLGAPGAGVMPLALWMAQTLSGARFDAIRPVDLARQTRCPILLIQSGRDDFVDPRDAGAINEAIKEHATKQGFPASTVWRVEDAPHLQALTQDPGKYAKRIEAFVASALESTIRK